MPDATAMAVSDGIVAWLRHRRRRARTVFPMPTSSIWDGGLRRPCVSSTSPRPTSPRRGCPSSASTCMRAASLDGPASGASTEYAAQSPRRPHLGGTVGTKTDWPTSTPPDHPRSWTPSSTAGRRTSRPGSTCTPAVRVPRGCGTWCRVLRGRPVTPPQRPLTARCPPPPGKGCGSGAV